MILFASITPPALNLIALPIAASTKPLIQRQFTDCLERPPRDHSHRLSSPEGNGFVMVQVVVNRLTVDFPYDPYPSQLRYMSNVIDALRNGSNALLESPTGTGKTLCLLCAALAWRATYVAALQTHAHVNPDATPNMAAQALLADAGLRPQSGGATSALSALTNSASAAQLAAPRIIFSSRTHSQLSQAVSELKKTIYRPAMTILASRDQLCLHDASSTLSGSRLNSMCRRLTAPSRRQCRFHLPVASPRQYENRSAELVEKLHAQPPLDIEDLRAFGSAEGACPFFLSRVAARDDASEILFLPYNYLLDKSARQSLEIDWANDVIIIDEAHNLEAVCENAMGFDLSAPIRQAADAEFSKLIETALRPGGLFIPALEQKMSTAEGVDSVIGSENRCLLEVRLMRSILSEVENFISNAQLDRGQPSDIQYRVMSGDHLRNLLQSAGGPSIDSYELFLEMLDRAMDIQAEGLKLNAAAQQDSESGNNSSNSAIRLLQTAIRVLYETAGRGEERAFRVVVQAKPSNPASGRTLSYWSFKPALAMRKMTNLNLRSLLLTSGTLAPLDAFASELGLPFPVRLENPHVVTAPQVWAGVVKSGPDGFGVNGGRLSSAYVMRGEGACLELGRTLIRIAHLVPDGLLVFFPSYSSLFSNIETWRRLGPGVDRVKPSVWERLSTAKQIVVEERESNKTAAAILAHKANVDAGRGSMLLAVCRGKVAEGIDFSDEYGRAVVITGLPYPSAADPRVVLKREYADEMLRESGQPSGAPRAMSGAQWYTMQTMRAVNQAVGRAIRHRLDYGAILLCDERFQSGHLQGLISKWIRPRLQTPGTFAAVEASLDRFFEIAKQSDFAREAAVRRSAVRQAEAQRPAREGEDSTAAVRVAQDALSRMMPSAPRMDEAFVQKMVSMSDAFVRKDSDDNGSTVRDAGQCNGTSALTAFNFHAGRTGGICTRVEQQSQANDVPTPTLTKGTRSEQFLAQRAASRGNTPAPVAKRRRAEPSGRAKLSERIKDTFSGREHVRGFLALFREMLAADSTAREGDPAALAGARAQGRDAVRRVVQYVKEHGVSGVESFLNDLADRVPVAMRAEYDQARAMK